MDYLSLLQLAEQTALSAGAILREGFGGSFSIANKEGRHNLVTEYDHRSEDCIISAIHSQYPEHSFLAEESGASGNEAISVRWIIDPLDGTVNFAHSIPLFCVSIAAEIAGEIVCGVIYQPLLNELFSAVKGGGAFLNGNRIYVSSKMNLEDAILVTGFPYNVSDNPNNCIDHFSAFLRLGVPIRRLGSAALDLAYTAAGRFDGFWEARLNPWDLAAGMLLVSESGGIISDYHNNPYHFGTEHIVASNGLIHDEMLTVIKSIKSAAL